MQEILLESRTKTPVKLRIFTQWLAVVVVRIPAYPKAGPEVDQLTPVVFIVEQQVKPTDIQLSEKAAERLGVTKVNVLSIETYRTDRVQYVAETTNPVPDEPVKE